MDLRFRRLRGDLRIDDLTAEEQLELAYELILRRPPDSTGAEAFLNPLRTGEITPGEVGEMLIGSGEWWAGVRMRHLPQSLHFSRCMFVRSLPKGRRILDLGGTALGAPEGAMVIMGYPYQFDELIVVDLPPQDRGEGYQEDVRRDVTQTGQGPVRFAYHSMTDLSRYEDASFDLVYAGQSIEHVPVEVADRVLGEVARVLKPTGHFALDTPNARVCRLQQAQFIDADHDYEYTHAEMVEKITRAGFEVVEAKGLNWAGRVVEGGSFSIESVATMRGLYAAIEECYLLAYVCRPRFRAAAG